MRLQRLRIEQLRVIQSAELVLGPGVNWLVGLNGSGKSSLLEGVSLLASGRSFRGGSPDACVRRGTPALTVFAEAGGPDAGIRRLGLTRIARGGFEARVDARPVGTLSDLFQVFPAVVLPADTGELISGPGEGRRRFMDWGLFHVEQAFLDAWRRFARALKQRNLALRTRQPLNVERAWRTELGQLGSELHHMRAHYLDALLPHARSVASWLMPHLGDVRLTHRPGWPEDRESFQEALDRVAETDRRQGFTSIGPQRAGWALTFDTLPQREMFSRGQAKLASLLMLLAQVSHFAACRGEAPVLGLDDALAELDRPTQQRLLDYLASLSVQVLAASADPDAVERLAHVGGRVFHVEQGVVTGPV